MTSLIKAGIIYTDRNHFYVFTGSCIISKKNTVQTVIWSAHFFFFHQTSDATTTSTSLSPHPFIHASIRLSLSKPAVCDFPHMQSCCLLHCFVFKGGDCLSKPREMAKPEIICIITAIVFNPNLLVCFFLPLSIVSLSI